MFEELSIAQRHLNRGIIDRAVEEAVQQVTRELGARQAMARGSAPYPVKGNITRDAGGNKVERWSFGYPLDGTRPLG